MKALLRKYLEVVKEVGICDFCDEGYSENFRNELIEMGVEPRSEEYKTAMNVVFGHIKLENTIWA